MSSTRDAAPATAGGHHAGAGAAGDLGALARGGALNLVGSLAYGFLNFLLVVIVTRGLGRDGSGVFFEAVALFIIASNTAELGADTGLVRSISRYRSLGRTHDTRWTLAIALLPAALAGVAFACLALVFAGPLSHVFGHGQSPDAVAPYIRLLALFLPLSAINTVAIAGTRGFGTMIPSVTLDKIAKPFGWCVLSFAVISGGLGAGAIALAYGVPIGLSFVAALSWLLVIERRAEHRASGDERQATPVGQLTREFWRFTAPRGLAGVFQVAILWLDTLLIGALRSAGEAAVYTASSRYIVVGQAILQSMMQAIAPQISGLLAAEEHDRAETVYQAGTTWLMVLSWPVYLTMAVFAPVLLQVFGRGFEDGAPVLVILSLAMLVSMACGPVDVVLLMGGRSWWSAANTGVSLAVNVVLNLVLIPRFGITGSAIAWMVSILLRNILPLIQVSRFLHMSPFGRGSLAAAAVSVPVFGGLGLLARWSFGPSLTTLVWFAAVAGAIYVAILWRLRDVLQLGVLADTLRRRRGGRGGSQT